MDNGLVIGVIPDGNRRFADAHNLSHLEGHALGLEKCLEIGRAALRTGRVKHYFVWGSSMLNFENRDAAEIAYLWELLRRQLVEGFAEDEVRFRLCGAWRQYVPDSDIIPLADRVEADTAKYADRTFTVLFGYGGQIDIRAAVAGLLNEPEPSVDDFPKHLLTKHIPEVNLLIRTGCKHDPEIAARGGFSATWSDGFMPWQMLATELRFFNKFWPEFTVADLHACIESLPRSRRMRGR